MTSISEKINQSDMSWKTWFMTISTIAMLILASVFGANVIISYNIEQRLGAIENRIDIPVNSTVSAFMKEASYIITKHDAYTCMINGSDDRAGRMEYWDTNASKVFSFAVGNLTSGGRIHVKAGTYSLIGVYITFSSNIDFGGEGDSTIITMTNGAYFNFYEVDNCTLHDFKIIQGQNASGSTGAIDISYNGDNNKVKCVTILGADNYGIYGYECNGTIVNECRFENSRDTDVYIATNSHHTKILDCTSISPTDQAFSVYGNCSDALIFGNTICNSNRDGIVVQGSTYSTVAYNTLDTLNATSGVGGIGIDIGTEGGNSAYNKIIGNTIYNPDNDGIYVKQSSGVFSNTNLKIAQNILNLTTQSRHGIELDFSGTGSIDDVTIEFNEIYNIPNGYLGVALHATLIGTSNVTIKNNIGYISPSDQIGTASVIISTDGTTVTAVNCTSGAVMAQSTASNQVFQTTFNSATNSHIFIRKGVYTLNGNISLPTGNTWLDGEIASQNEYSVPDCTEIVTNGSYITSSPTSWCSSKWTNLVVTVSGHYNATAAINLTMAVVQMEDVMLRFQADMDSSQYFALFGSGGPLGTPVSWNRVRIYDQRPVAQAGKEYTYLLRVWYEGFEWINSALTESISTDIGYQELFSIIGNTYCRIVNFNVFQDPDFDSCPTLIEFQWTLGVTTYMQNVEFISTSKMPGGGYHIYTPSAITVDCVEPRFREVGALMIPTHSSGVTLYLHSSGLLTEAWGTNSTAADGGVQTTSLAGTITYISVTSGNTTTIITGAAISGTSFTYQLKSILGAAVTGQTVYWYARYDP